MRALILLLAIVLWSGSLPAQDRKKQNMTRDDRERLREDMRQVHRDKSGRPDRPRQMTPQERDKLRRDVQEASKDLKR